MSKKYPGGFITKTPVIPTPSSAKGVWTLDQQMQYQKDGVWPFGGPFNYVEDVFSTYLYTGTGTTQSIVNGIDLAGKGGLVWIKRRQTVSPASNGDHSLRNSATGTDNYLVSNLTDAQSNSGTGSFPFNNNGFTLNSFYHSEQDAGVPYASWTFRKQPKFFDVVTYTGTGSNTTISHSLGSVPGCIIVKRTDTTGAWQVYHGSLANTQYMVLNTTAAVATGATRWNSTAPTTSVFSVGTDATVNASGGTYVAYIFAHNAGGFGLTGTDNVISCGSYTTDASGNATVNLGYEPQWLLHKDTINPTNWEVLDTMRGWNQTANNLLKPNLSAAESVIATGVNIFTPTATGFIITGYNASDTYIYIAIRRPMKVPTDATKVFAPVTATLTSAANTVTTNFPVDLAIPFYRGGFYANWFDRLRGSSQTNGVRLRPATTAAEVTTPAGLGFDNNTGYVDNYDYTYVSPTGNYVYWNFSRAPGFFDEVCWTQVSSGVTLNHNLAVIPELIILKTRNTVDSWWTFCSAIAAYNPTAGTNKACQLETNSAFAANNVFDGLAPSSTQFTTSTYWNGSSCVAYLFASCPGVSKVGSYTGNGTTQTINCGFTAGARFVMIKRTDATSDWFTYDTARGMTTTTDPYLPMNGVTEVATLGSVTTVTTGFALNAGILAAVNASGGSYIFLAIA